MARTSRHDSANPADHATTANERQHDEAAATAEAAERVAVTEAADAKRRQRAADATYLATIARLRAQFSADHPDADEAEFERQLPGLLAT